MTDRAPERLAAAVAVLVAAAGVVLALGARPAASLRTPGLPGTGTAATLVPCEAAFDPGVSGTCTYGLDPVPGAFPFCPHHAGPSLGR